MILGLETSGRSGSAALDFPGGDVVSSFTPEGEGSARMLAPAVSELLRQSKVHTSDIQAVAVTIGPGSFTGLRVGVAMAKAIAYGLRIPTVGVDTLEVLAVDFERSLQYSGLGHRVEFWTVLDAYRGEFFVAKWRLSLTTINDSPKPSPSVPCGPTCLIASQILPQKSWYELAANDSSGTFVVGSGAAKLLANASANLRNFETFPNYIPTASSVISVANRMLIEGNFTSPIDLMPVYLRGSAAEEKKQATKTSP